MQQVAISFADLEKEARHRVAEWVMKRYGNLTAALAAGEHTSAKVSARRQEQTSEAASGGTGEFLHFAELYNAAGTPSTSSMRALVGGYWLQVCRGQESFASQEVNDLLKDQGYAVGNITNAFTALRESKPRLILQLGKSGKAKQARKTMKLTVEGIRKVKRMLAGETESN